MISQGHIQNADVLGETVDRIMAAELYTFAYRDDSYKVVIHAFPRDGGVYPRAACFKVQWLRSLAWTDVDGFSHTGRDCKACVKKIAKKMKLLKNRRSWSAAGARCVPGAV